MDEVNCRRLIILLMGIAHMMVVPKGIEPLITKKYMKCQ